MPKQLFQDYMALNKNRKGDFIITKYGHAVWPLDPNPEEIDIKDIAYALAFQNRYAGHAGLYSVAQHSLAISRLTRPENALWGLLHDAEEAYLPDIPSPVKRFISEYKTAGKKLHAVICQKFGMAVEEPAEILELDQRIVVNEMTELMPEFPFEFEFKDKALSIDFAAAAYLNYNPYRVWKIFLDRFQWLTTGEGKDPANKYPNPFYP